MRAVFAVLVALCFWNGPAAAAGVEDLKAGLEHVQAGNYKKARDSLSSALESQELSQQQRGLAHLLRGLSSLALRDNEAGRVDLDQAIALLEDDGMALNLRAALASDTGDKEQALKDVLRLAREFPEDLNQVETSLIWRLWRWLNEEERDDDRFMLLESVVKAGYRPEGPGQSTDGLIQEYIGMLVERGRPAEAMPWVEEIATADPLVEMRVNGRFRPLWDEKAFDAHTQPRDAAERERRHWEAEATKHPDSLKIVLYHMQILRALGESKTAIERGQSVLDNLDDYNDSEEYRLWILNELAYALMDEGRTEDADARLKPLMKRSVEEEPNLVSQFINYGAVLNRLGEPERALEAVAKVTKGVSSYGKKWIEAAKVCANRQLNRAAEAEAALKRLKTKPEENYAAVSQGLVCLNRIGEAAQLAVARLRDPDHRESMLMALQSYRDRSPVSSVDKEMRRRWEKVRSHPEVLAEARKQGRLLSIDLYPVYWGDY